MSFPVNPSFGDVYTTLMVSYTYDGTAWVPKTTKDLLQVNDPKAYPAGTSGLTEYNTDTNTYAPVNLPVVAGAGTTYARPAISDGAVLKWDQANNHFIAAIAGVDYIDSTAFTNLVNDFNNYKAAHP